MSYQALLFCPDEKTARVVTQVLTELEFSVEACSEPFAAVKKLMATQFDAIVVDCDNEQNSALLFKSARNSTVNQSSLAVAVVEGQAGVAKAFRIGANLVLTKPINVEQSKGTLRVARGLLRKAEAGKASAAQSAAKPADHFPGDQPPSIVNPAPLPAFSKPFMSAKSATAPFSAKGPSDPAISAPVASSASVEVEEEAMPKLEPTEVAFLESIPDPSRSKPATSNPAASNPTIGTGKRQIETLGASKASPWQPMAKPVAETKTTSRSSGIAGQAPSGHAPGPNVAALVVPPASKRHPFNTGLSSVAGAAVAPALAPDAPSARMVPPPIERETANASLASAQAPKLEVAGDVPFFASEAQESKSRMPLIAVVAILVLAAAGYLGWSKLHTGTSIPIIQSQPGVTPTQAAATLPPAELGQSSPEITGDSQSAGSPLPATQDPSQPATKLNQNLAAESQMPRISAGEQPAAAKSPAARADSAPDVEVKVIIPQKNVAEAVVKSTPAEVEQIAVPPSLQDSTNANEEAIAGLVETPSLPVPKHSPEILKISQGVTEGMLLKKVAPHYPPQAVQMHKQGTVLLLANIGKTGSITNAKVIKGDLLLAQAALAAVQQWKYKPYLLDGQPIEVQTQVSVTFKLP